MSSSAVKIGLNIKAARKEAGLSQSELAQKIGKSLRTVQGYESGETGPSITMIHEIAKALGVTSTSIMGYERSGIQLKTFDDIMVALLELSEISEINMEIDVKKPPHYDEWSCTLKFNGADREAPYNADLCLFLEELRDISEANMRATGSTVRNMTSGQIMPWPTVLICPSLSGSCRS